MCIRDSVAVALAIHAAISGLPEAEKSPSESHSSVNVSAGPVSYTHLRAHETVLDLVCRLLLEKKTLNTTYDTCLYPDYIHPFVHDT